VQRQRALSLRPTPQKSTLGKGSSNVHTMNDHRSPPLGSALARLPSGSLGCWSLPAVDRFLTASPLASVFGRFFGESASVALLPRRRWAERVFPRLLPRGFVVSPLASHLLRCAMDSLLRTF